jgi:hypothetical protein
MCHFVWHFAMFWAFIGAFTYEKQAGAGIEPANRDKILTVDQIEEIFAEMRRVTDWLQEKANGASASLDLSSASALNRATLRTP